MSNINLTSLLKTMVEQGASDLHITVGVPPEFRISGLMVRAKMDPLTAQDTQDLCYAVINESQKAEFEKNFEIDFQRRWVYVAFSRSRFGIEDIHLHYALGCLCPGLVRGPSIHGGARHRHSHPRSLFRDSDSHYRIHSVVTVRASLGFDYAHPAGNAAEKIG